MRVLILGGTRFVGPAFVEGALARGWQVTVANRGRSGHVPSGVRHVLVDRVSPDPYRALVGERYDVVVDTWAGAPRVVRDAARAVAADRWVYVSSRSVYAFPPPHGADETAPVVEADPDGDGTEYPQDKRGAELALERDVGPEHVILLRAGLIIGPGDTVGRLPWWLRRIARGGPTVAPSPADLPVQYVDPRDLAALGLDAATMGRSGPVDVACPAGSTTMRDILEACVRATGSDAELTWVDARFLLDRGVSPWTELPIWIPPWEDAYAFHDGDVSRALAWGLRIRPLAQTVADCWSGMRSAPAPAEPPHTTGLDPVKESEVLAAWAAASSQTAPAD